MLPENESWWRYLMETFSALLAICTRKLGTQFTILHVAWKWIMMTLSNGNIFRVTGPLCGEVRNIIFHFTCCLKMNHDGVIKWKHFPRYWPFVRGIHRSPVNSQHKGQWHGALMFSLICIWINGWVNNREAGDLRRYRAYYDDTVM